MNTSAARRNIIARIRAAQCRPAQPGAVEHEALTDYLVRHPAGQRSDLRGDLVELFVGGLEDAFALMRAERGELPSSVNFISGPSRTGDIEQTIVLGAHGPYRVHAVVVRDA
ncbi:LUD domain-containing protein [Mycetohabitans sp. B5]|uniref:YkgG family uncharacterized protein n=1 Tax=Mycetohabitans endofungorum TaxID=417203 RepID=A0A2P5KEJ2_9BURK|nr:MULTISPECIES: LUD domain-containing protein [Mycetohabitans]MCG1053965.1 LUD domain-containing protein [Mycetohabitans sp. B5]PPB85132.1 YkgG family uncharacterized protein [Mycetohabitans endofungorum]